MRHYNDSNIEDATIISEKKNKVNHQSDNNRVTELLRDLANVSPKTIATIGLGVAALAVGMTKLFDELDL